MTTIVYEDHQKQTIEAFARGLFYFGAFVSSADAFLTWLVVRSAGTSVEQNWGMGWLMRHLGLAPTMILRAGVGIFLFWYVSNIIVGRRIFFRAKRAAKYSAWLAKEHTGRFSSWLFRNRPTITAIEALFVLVLTAGVVGNNIEAAVVWFRHVH